MHQSQNVLTRKKVLSCFLITFTVMFFVLLIYYNSTLATFKYKTKMKEKAASEEIDYNIWAIFTRTGKNSRISYNKFRDFVLTVINVTSVPLKLNIIIDKSSRDVTQKIIHEITKELDVFIFYTLYEEDDCVKKIADIIDIMTPYFSNTKGYYKDPLFYMSLGLYRIAPLTQKRIVLLDIDIYLNRDIKLLFDEFDKMKPSALLGLAPELSPHYYKIFNGYRKKHPNSTMGLAYDPFKNITTSVPHPKGFQGYNSGVVLLDLAKIRNSQDYQKIITKNYVKRLSDKYMFKGELGDQDFYTLLGYEAPDLIQTLHCGFNRQLCKSVDRKSVFFKCEHEILVLHGNCNTKIPRD